MSTSGRKCAVTDKSARPGLPGGDPTGSYMRILEPLSSDNLASKPSLGEMLKTYIFLKP